MQQLAPLVLRPNCSVHGVSSAPLAAERALAAGFPEVRRKPVTSCNTFDTKTANTIADNEFDLKFGVLKHNFHPTGVALATFCAALDDDGAIPLPTFKDCYFS